MNNGNIDLCFIPHIVQLWSYILKNGPLSGNNPVYHFFQPDIPTIATASLFTLTIARLSGPDILITL